MPRVLACLLLCFLVFPACRRRTPEESYERGVRYLEKKDYNRARIELRNAVRGNAGFAAAYYQLGVASMELKEGDAAFDSLLRAEQLDMGKGKFSIDTRLRLGLLLLSG